MLEILVYGSPVLRKKAVPVEIFDETLQHFVDEMIESMMSADGVGLAAPQVGRSLQLAVIDVTVGKEPPLVLINPQITFLSKETEEREEGCLSVPDINVKIVRPSIVSVAYLTATGEKKSIEKAEGLLARAIQHEHDHLNGLMIIDHISMLQRSMLKNKLKKLAESSSRA